LNQTAEKNKLPKSQELDFNQSLRSLHKLKGNIQSLSFALNPMNQSNMRLTCEARAAKAAWRGLCLDEQSELHKP